MKHLSCAEFQATVGEYTIRHRSILDILSKTQEAAARLNRAVTKAVTGCGCVQINATKQALPSDISLRDWRHYVDTHLQGSLCEDCRDIVETEMGRLLFYLAALANTLGLSLEQVMAKEKGRITTLNIFNFT
ncbi:MAG: DUF1573 domain-containing protein [Clostridia bacterium]|nr:DUF1573 domain-containing protein [Clostridia bacterium]